MSNNTPNLGLLKKDPMVDGNETFNIKTMLNDNWDKIDEVVGQVREDLGNIDVELPDASLTEKGIVQLSNATNGTRENVAATEKAVKAAYDEALAGKQLGVEQKANVVAALNSIGVAASTSETWAQLIPKIAAVIRATGNATVADVIAGKTFSNASENGLTGTIPDRGAGGTVTPNTADQTKEAGRYTSAITIKGEPNLIVGNLPKDKTFFGVTGLLERMTTAEKRVIANAITGKGVAASANDTNTVLANKIGLIQTTKYASGSLYASEGRVYVSGVGFRPKMIKLYGDYYNSESYFTVCFLFDDPIRSAYGFLTPNTSYDGGVMSGVGSNLRDNLITNSGFNVYYYYWLNNLMYWEAWGH
ncbi:Phage tail fibre repeat-containing protein [Paenibacillus uliginis N3/975]|uniref:Phage tail fibre repeat-containing protein n=1 Tax=Paenibacillus uliginis N3/975 TaxID=1313296 RepID=A0A1X7GNS4_9BACL|nr:phage tail protein [Paenibacillus uliginis]SMF72357.1 Phage tail fibre repeat-containing protein [Paenibacillus uliginis N3/975]